MNGDPIMIADDNESNLKLMRALLESSGYLVKTATDADRLKKSSAKSAADVQPCKEAAG